MAISTGKKGRYYDNEKEIIEKNKERLKREEKEKQRKEKDEKELELRNKENTEVTKIRRFADREREKEAEALKGMNRK